ncbi:hypothetical protein AD947_08125 [Acetobacter tropicalis]|uniref:Uncharacterized protein n=1 Tax=Acetobacter tropicalis TaxID=104102 RepID=A0A149TX14_9PROT|nr:hypothetical protein AD947_08125 [Acetobacter tropicalis]
MAVTSRTTSSPCLRLPVHNIVTTDFIMRCPSSPSRYFHPAGYCVICRRHFRSPDETGWHNRLTLSMMRSDVSGRFFGAPHGCYLLAFSTKRNLQAMAPRQKPFARLCARRF